VEDALLCVQWCYVHRRSRQLVEGIRNDCIVDQFQILTHNLALVDWDVGLFFQNLLDVVHIGLNESSIFLVLFVVRVQSHHARLKQRAIVIAKETVLDKQLGKTQLAAPRHNRNQELERRPSLDSVEHLELIKDVIHKD